MKEQSEQGAGCVRQSLQVRLAPEAASTYTAVGWLCGAWHNPRRTVQVLISGATYSHVYWNLPYHYPSYSYVHEANRAGYVTFNIDRIGTGESDRPPAEQVGITTGAYVVHQIVQALRAGTIRGTAFTRVMLVTHSIGSQIAVEEAATYHDVDGVVLSGFLHNFNPELTPYLVGAFSPASDDPQFMGKNIPAGYLTTVPGVRGNRGLYYQPGAAPQVIAADEATKDTATVKELDDFLAALFSPLAQQIRTPVLIAHGEMDLNCGGPIPECTRENILVNEQPYYSPQACLQVAVIPESGHNVALHRAAPAWRRAVLDWSHQYVGADATRPPPRPCP